MSDQNRPGFNKTLFDVRTLKQEIKDLFGNIAERNRLSLEDYKNIGMKLCQIKKQEGDEALTKFVEQELKKDIRRAEEYMDLYRNWDKPGVAKAGNFSRALKIIRSLRSQGRGTAASRPNGSVIKPKTSQPKANGSDKKNTNVEPPEKKQPELVEDIEKFKARIIKKSRLRGDGSYIREQVGDDEKRDMKNLIKDVLKIYGWEYDDLFD